MGKFSQTIARIGLGLVAIGCGAVWFWPSDIVFLFQRPEAMFAFGVALCVWLATEVKTSEEVLYRSSTPNDIRVAREILALHSGSLRLLLKNHNTWNFLNDDHYDSVDKILNRHNSGRLTFQSKEILVGFARFVEELRIFHHFIANNASSEMVGGRFMTGFKPIRIVSEDEYARRGELADEANAFALTAWESLDHLAAKIRVKIPEALDVPIV